jgi:hypothetical protein
LDIHVQMVTAARSRRDLLYMLNRLVDLNRWLYRTRDLPGLYESGVRYHREKQVPGRKPVERWLAVDALYQAGTGDCEDLAAARVGWLRNKGEPAKIRLTRKGKLWHVTVRRANGEVEDPSRRLGMKGSA